MSSLNILIIIALLVSLLVSTSIGTAENVCTPNKMVRVVSRLDIAGAPANHFSRAPKTLYRYGSQYGRIEESYNPATGLQLLMVVDEPHVWMANLATHTGRYVRDSGPTYYFRATIFGDKVVESAFLRHLEIGCEITWIKEAGAIERNNKHPTLGKTRSLEYAAGKEKVILYHRSGKPLRVELMQDGKITFSMDYLEYESDLKFERKFFEKPSGVVFEGEKGP